MDQRASVPPAGTRTPASLPPLCGADLDQALWLWQEYQAQHLSAAQLRMRLRSLLTHLRQAVPDPEKRDGVDELELLEVHLTEWRWRRLLQQPQRQPEQVWSVLSEQFAAGAGTVTVRAPGLALEAPFTELHLDPAAGVAAALDGEHWSQITLLPLQSLQLVSRSIPAPPQAPGLILGVECTRKDGTVITFWRS